MITISPVNLFNNDNSLDFPSKFTTALFDISALREIVLAQISNSSSNTNVLISTLASSISHRSKYNLATFKLDALWEIEKEFEISIELHSYPTGTVIVT